MAAGAIHAKFNDLVIFESRGDYHSKGNVSQHLEEDGRFMEQSSLF
jgi:hypothetical protein